MAEYDQVMWTLKHLEKRNQSAQKVFFFKGEKYLGTDTSEIHGPTNSVTADDLGSIIVSYCVYQKNDPMSTPSGKPFEITYHWNGQKLIPSAPFQSQHLS